MVEYDLRQATEADRDFIWELSRITMREYVHAIWGWDEEYQAQRFLAYFQPGDWQIITVEGADAGAFEAKWKASEVTLARLYVTPELQRRGIGSAVVERLIHEAVKAGLPLTLDVLKSNPDALHLYVRLGLVVMDETPERVLMRTKPESSPA